MSVDQQWVESYQGEVYGELIFAVLAEQAEDPLRRRQFEVLAILERATRALAEPVMERRNLEGGDVTEQAAETARAVASKPWDELVSWFAKVTDHYIPIYRQLVQTALDDDERAVAEAYVAHEEALAAFGRRIGGQEAGDPLAPVLALPHMAGVTV